MMCVLLSLLRQVSCPTTKHTHTLERQAMQQKTKMVVKIGGRELATADAEERGAVFTKREIVEFLLDLIGFTSDQPIHTMRTLEPSFGGGDFLLPMVERVVAAWDYAGRKNSLEEAIFAVEIHHESFENTKRELVRLLHQLDVPKEDSYRLADKWLCSDDFLLTEIEADFDFVVGNPPYLRPERIPKPLLLEYRSRFSTMYDRADLYIPFIERSLDHLSANGTLAFVCANRWHKNKYGGPLRAKVDADYHLAYHVDLVGVDAFNREVIAYPAITVIRRDDGQNTVIARKPEVDTSFLSKLSIAMRSPGVHPDMVDVAHQVTSGRDPWLLHDAEKLALLRRLEREFPVIEEAECKIGIGVATGRDKVFIQPIEELDVEPARKLPLIKAPDIRSGRLEWSGLGLLNPYDEQGRLVELEDWPKFATLVRQHEVDLRKRSVAKRNHTKWFRTIDKVHPNLQKTPKLLIPDIKGEPHVVLDPGLYYPHHNLYWVTSQRWDLPALQAVLRSDVARLVIEAYCVVMSGGYLRFQAQYLRRIPIPFWDQLPEIHRTRLASVASSDDIAEVNCAVAAAYGLTDHELEVLTRR